MKTSLILKWLSESNNKLLTAQFSLIENIKTHGFASVDMADLINTTEKSNYMCLILEKQFFDKTETLFQKISIEAIPKNVKSIWVDIWIGTDFHEDGFDILDKIAAYMNEMFSDNFEVINIDAYEKENHQNSISIIAFG